MHLSFDDIQFSYEPYPIGLAKSVLSVRPKDMTRSFNHVDRYMGFDEVETLSILPFKPNQCVVFIKTFNSWHAVHPMRGAGSSAMRKTLTVNIVRGE